MSLKDETGETGLYEISGVSRNEKGRVELEFRRNTDARPSKVLRKIKGGRVRLTPDSLRELEGRKVAVDPLGRVRWAND
ncbi:MAG: hypothetical protein HY040_00545 [Planctomycetes bacterium]|nr:hypothetical protein [Planctomycetota bacterium]